MLPRLLLESARSVLFAAHAVYLVVGVLALVVFESDLRMLKPVARFTL